MAWCEREKTLVATSIPQVLRAFGLALSEDYILLDAGATPNISLLVRTVSDRYVLRCCRRDSREKRLRFLSKFHSHLSRSGIPIAKSIPTTWGDSLIRVGQWWWQAYSFLDGTPYDYNNIQHLEEAAYWLGRLHQISPTFKPYLYCAYDCATLGWWTSPQAYLDTCQHHLSALAREVGEKSRWDKAQEVFASWSRAIGERITPGQMLQLPSIWTHGDYHGGNLIFTGDQLLGVLDFDQADIRPRVYDVAFALLMMARRCRGTYELRPQVMARFLQVYESVVPPLSSQERMAIPSMMIASQLPDWGLLDALARCEGASSVANAIQYWTKVLHEISEQTLLFDLFSES